MYDLAGGHFGVSVESSDSAHKYDSSRVLTLLATWQHDQRMKVTNDQFVFSPSFDPPARRDSSSTEFRTNDRIVNERTAGKKQASLNLVAAQLFPRIPH